MAGKHAQPGTLPPYAYVPGHRPHPRRHPKGHAYGTVEAVPVVLDPDAWWDCMPFVEGLVLFDLGYYWEAHEAWEAPWRVAGRPSAVADLLGGLIALAAAGVKLRQGRAEAAARLGGRARQRFARARRQCDVARLAGLAFDDLEEFARAVEQEAPEIEASPEPAVEVVFSRPLSLARAPSP